MMRRFCALFIFVVTATATGSPHAQENWTLTKDIALTSRWFSAGKIHEQKITGDLFRPNLEGRLPAAVIINSSGGVTAHTELYYGRLLAAQGVAALVVDSFTPRGARRTTDDQSRVWQSQSDADAAGAFRWLAGQSWIDPDRIIVLGMSRGGQAALHMAVETERRRLRTADVRFAAHVAIATGGCSFQAQDARTTGAPIFFMLAELDDYTPIRPCFEYIDRMRAAGNDNIRLAVYPGVYHAYESVGGIHQQQAETGSACSVFRNPEGRLIDRRTGAMLPVGRERATLMQGCVQQRAVTTGGDIRVKAQATADLVQFLRDIGIVEDREARAVVPDCTTIADGIHRRNCVRARAGWTGDLVALARAYRYPGGLARDDALAGRLFKLAADRGHPQAQWELSIVHRQGAGVPRDHALALSLARASAEAGEHPAFNVMGVMARDGIGQPRDDAAAAAWFRKAAELRNPPAFVNLGRFYWEGRGGLALDRSEAVKLFRKAAFYENPWGELYLAEALEQGEGVTRDAAEALKLYRAAAAQDRDLEAKRRAGEALKRLGEQGPAPVRPE